jgi:hypothetical protein
MHSRHNVIVYYTRTIWRQDQYHNHSATQTMHCANQSHTRTSASVSHYTPTFIFSTFYTPYKVQITLKPVWFCFKYIGAICCVIKSLFVCTIALISNSYFLSRKEWRTLLSNRDVVYIGGGKTELFVHYWDDCAFPGTQIHCLAFSSQIYCFESVNI